MMLHIRRRQCETCIFGRNSPVSDERVAEMVTKCGDQGAIPCHKHLYVGEKINPVCHGFYALRGNLVLRLAEAFDVIEWTE
jgi:hypothetical protein